MELKVEIEDYIIPLKIIDLILSKTLLYLAVQRITLWRLFSKIKKKILSREKPCI